MKPNKKARRVPLKTCLFQLGAFNEGVMWAARYRSPEKAWRECKRGDWMLWLIGTLDNSKPWSKKRKPIVRCAAECARLALPHTSDPRVLACIETVERWCDGRARRSEVEAASEAVDVAASDAWGCHLPVSNSAMSASAWAALHVVCVARAGVLSASKVTHCTASAAALAARRSKCVAESHAKSAALAQCADIVRRHYPEPPITEDVDAGSAKGGATC